MHGGAGCALFNRSFADATAVAWDGAEAKTPVTVRSTPSASQETGVKIFAKRPAMSLTMET
jgi:hypothetical protein